MNVLIADPAGAHPADHLFARSAGLARPDRTAVLRPDGGGWVVRSAAGAVVTTALPPEGVLCGALLTCDLFDWDAELLLLGGDPDGWPGHLLRLSEAHELGLDAFLSFDPSDRPVETVGYAADAPPYTDRPDGPPPALVWVRRTGDFYEIVQTAVRKGPGPAGGYGPAALVRELLLRFAPVGWQYDSREPVRVHPAAGSGGPQPLAGRGVRCAITA